MIVLNEIQIKSKININVFIINAVCRDSQTNRCVLVAL